MYPFRDENVFLKNCWYVAATAHEIDAGPLERIIMDNPVAVFRMQDGRPAAMHGVCPHRYYPLARGKVVGNTLQCNYHGFRFDGTTGSCVAIPSQSAAPRAYRQRTYPVAEHGSWIWIWPGDPQRADPALLPPLEEMGAAAGWTVQVGRCFHGKGRAQLLVENLLDLTHIDFLHATTLRAEAVLDFPVKLRESQGKIFVTRLSRTPWVEGFYDLIYGRENRFEGMHDSVGDTWYWSPAYLRTGLAIDRIEAYQELDRRIFGKFYFQHFITPETRKSCHYFAGMSRDYRCDDEQLSQIMLETDHAVRQQDIEAIEAIETQLARPWTLGQELLAKADAPAIHVRRAIQNQLDAETHARTPERLGAAQQD